MAQNDYDYDKYATMAGGRLFNNAMMGFNKDEVLAYLEELTDENQRQQEADKRRIQQLSRQMQTLEADMDHMARSGGGQGANNDALYAQLDKQQQQIQRLMQELDHMQQAPSMQAPDPHLQNQVYALEDELGNWKAEYNKAEQHIYTLQDEMDRLGIQQKDSSEVYSQMDALRQEGASLQQSFDEALHTGESYRLQLEETSRNSEETRLQKELAQQQLSNAQQEIYNMQAQMETYRKDISTLQQQGASQEEVTKLQQQLEEAWASIDFYQNQTQEDVQRNAQVAASSIILDANAEAERIRGTAVHEKERLYRQIRTSATGLSESIFNLRTEVSDVEGNLSHVLESMQHTMVNVLSSLAQTEQDLSTFTVQVERFPLVSPAVTRSDTPAIMPHKDTSSLPNNSPAYSPAPPQHNNEPAVQHNISPPQNNSAAARKRNNVRTFRPTYSNGSTSGNPYYSGNSSEARQSDEYEDSDARLKNLSDNLVDTLRQMMN